MKWYLKKLFGVKMNVFKKILYLIIVFEACLSASRFFAQWSGNSELGTPINTDYADQLYSGDGF